MRDPYVVLGVDRKASEADIKSAYRKLAKRHHPDRNPNDPKAKEKFAEATHAYEIVGDKQKRRQFDRGEIDAEGKAKFAGFEGFRRRRPAFRRGRRPRKPVRRLRIFDALEPRRRRVRRCRRHSAIDFWRRAAARDFRGESAGPQPNLDIQADARVEIADLARGKANVTFPDGRTLAFALPAEPAEGQIVRLAGQGRKAAGRKPGDALVTLHMAPHPRFSVSGADLRASADLPMETAVNGGKIEVETIDGRISLAIPAWTDSGTVFRLRGKGLPKKGGGHGDLLVTVEIRLPADRRQSLQSLFAKAETRR